MTDQARRRNGQPFTWVDNKILNDYGARMGANGLAVWMCLSQMADNNTGESYPALKTIAGKVGFKTTAPVEVAIKNLVDLGLLLVEPRFREDGSRTSNLYTLLDPTDDTPPPTEEIPQSTHTDIPPGRYTKQGSNYTQELDSFNSLDSIESQQPTSAGGDSPGVESHAGVKKRKRTVTAWERTRHELAEEFTRVTGIKMPTQGQGIFKHKQARWYGPLKTIYDAAGEDVPRAKGLIAQVVADMRKDKLTIASPQSIEQLAIAQAAEVPQKGSGMTAW